MRDLELYLLFLTCILFILYFVGLVLMRNIFHRLITHTPPLKTAAIKLSIVIPFRNEASNLPSLLTSISLLDYPKSDFEILFVDDHSGDDSVPLIQDFITNHPTLKVHLLRSSVMHQGKKSNVRRGIDAAVHEFIVSTDADCTLPKSWLTGICMNLQNPATQLLCLPVKMKTTHGFIQRYEALDFLFLNTITACFAFLRKPILCNAAAMAYPKKTFHDYVQSERYNENIASGDDMFFLEYVLSKHGAGSIQFANTFEMGIVETQATQSLAAFINQRVRWIKKSSHLNIPYLATITRTIALVNMLFLICIVACVMNQSIYVGVAMLCISLKYLGELALFLESKKAYAQSFSISDFTISFLAYPWITGYIYIKSLVTANVAWKGRIIKK